MRRTGPGRGRSQSPAAGTRQRGKIVMVEAAQEVTEGKTKAAALRKGTPAPPKKSAARVVEEEEEEREVEIEEEFDVEEVVVTSLMQEEDPATTNAIRISYMLAFVSSFIAYFKPSLLLHDLEMNDVNASATIFLSIVLLHIGLILSAVAQCNHEAKKKVLQYMIASNILFAIAPAVFLYSHPFSPDKARSIFFNMIVWLLVLGINLHACYYSVPDVK